MTDADRLDWLEQQANKGEGIHLHDGGHAGCLGLGLARLGRTLRQAIDGCMEHDRIMANATPCETEPAGSSTGGLRT
jgi:hypothetical protein